MPPPPSSPFWRCRSRCVVSLLFAGAPSSVAPPLLCCSSSHVRQCMRAWSTWCLGGHSANGAPFFKQHDRPHVDRVSEELAACGGAAVWIHRRGPTHARRLGLEEHSPKGPRVGPQGLHREFRCRPSIWQISLLEHHAQAWGIAAVLWGWVDQRAWPTLAGVSCDKPVVMERGAKQGAPYVEVRRQRDHPPARFVMGGHCCSGVVLSLWPVAHSLVCGDTIKLYTRRLALVSSTPDDGIPFSGDSLGILRKDGRSESTTVFGDMRFALRPKLKVLGVAIGTGAVPLLLVRRGNRCVCV